MVIAAGQVNDVRLYRDLVASGIQDYLLKPFTADQLRDAFANAQMTISGPRVNETVDREAAIVTAAVIGVRGGVGASTVASSLAWLMGDKAGRSAALLDLDVHFGTGALVARPRARPRPDRRDRESEPHRRPVHRTRDGPRQRQAVRAFGRGADQPAAA